MLPVVIVAALYFAYTLVSRRLRPTLLTAPLLFVAVGLLIGNEGLGVMTPTTDPGLVSKVLEVTLVLALFTDAAAVPLGELRRDAKLALRLLAIGLPLTIALGWLLGIPLFPTLGLWEVAVLATILAPTDAALGQSVVANPRAPAIVRQGLAIESGLNDGLALPVLTIFLAAAAEAAAEADKPGVLQAFAQGLLLAAVIGGGAGWLGGRLLVWAAGRGWATRHAQQAAVVALALAAWAAATMVGGSGFIAAWVGGSLFGSVSRDVLPDSREFGEDLAEGMVNISFLLFGAVMLGSALAELSWQVLLYAVLSLAVVRMVPVALAMIRSGYRSVSVAYMGWFGPRGLASIVFIELVFEEALPGAGLIEQVVLVTVGLSVLLHGLSAWPGSQLYARWFERHKAAGEPLVEARETVAPVPRRIHGDLLRHRRGTS
jgi:NhaP-type Na+/H+ or K+/H+ antiporter